MRKPVIYSETKPGTAAVDAVWRLDVNEGAPAALPHLVLPDGCLDLLVQFRRLPSGRIVEPHLSVVGPQNRSELFYLQPGDGFIGVRFNPGWAGRALRLAASDFVGIHVAAVEVSHSLEGLAARIADSTSTQHIERILADEAALWHAESDRGLDAIRLLRRSRGRMPVRDLAAKLQISQRTLRRDVIAAAGLPPKALARVFRFRHAMKLRRCQRGDLAGIAAMAGYADQAHMTRDFTALGGFTPGALPASLHL